MSNAKTLAGTVSTGGVLSTGQVSATQVTGTLPVANGGTGATSLTANNVILGNGTSAVQVVAPGSSGNVLTSNGTTWQSTAPAASGFTLGTPITTTSGTAADFTNIPSGVKQVIVSFNGVSFASATYVFNALLGTSGGFVTSNYVSAARFINTTTSNAACYSTSQITMVPNATGNAPGAKYYGQLTLTLVDSASYIWAWSFAVGLENSGEGWASVGGGAITLSSNLTQIRIQGGSAAGTFDAGSINIMYI
jgi:hypothetical protein